MSSPMRCNFLSRLLILLSFFLSLAVAVPEPQPDASSPPELSNTTLDEISSLHQTADASCVGYEGQWNCLYDTFQRCDAGKWTAALACGSQSGNLNKRDHSETHCTPLGRTDLVEFEGECSAAWGFGGGGGWNGGGGGGRTTVCNGNGCYYGAGANLTVDKWWYVVVVGVVALGFL
ncbi:hypothetical protein CSOJ01_13219 [Colletotrichum sojae]|uniref:Uncharacterized protein n=1 Tax=Colletotrichum sojae TaxID=2175907 RepID=A0A8H6ITI6_9PEZI|nr:hypothetical protein CSOJ01_13219 [Colletotrichum sojae]